MVYIISQYLQYFKKIKRFIEILILIHLKHKFTNVYVNQIFDEQIIL